MRFLLFALIAVPASGAIAADLPSNPPLEVSFRLMYELKFETARDRLGACRKADPNNSLCLAAEAASYLFMAMPT